MLGSSASSIIDSSRIILPPDPPDNTSHADLEVTLVTLLRLSWEIVHVGEQQV
jgi:hypothetical protein